MYEDASGLVSAALDHRRLAAVGGAGVCDGAARVDGRPRTAPRCSIWTPRCAMLFRRRLDTTLIIGARFRGYGEWW